MDQRISLITLGVRDLDRAKSFYDRVGWTATSVVEDTVFYQVGGMIVSLWGRDKLAADTAVTDSGGWGGITLAYNTRDRAEVDRVLAEAAAAGGSVLRPAAETFWGGYAGVFADPEGHPWEVAHNPGWTITDDGRTLIAED